MWQALSSIAGLGGDSFDKYYGTPATSFAWNGKSMRRNIRYQKKMMNFQNELNRENQIWTATNMPSYTVSGLRNANLNPLLAFSDFSGLSSSGAMGVSPASVSADNGAVGSGFSGLDLDSAFGTGFTSRSNRRQAQKAEKKEIENRSIKADMDRETIEATREGASALASAKIEAETRRYAADAMAEQNRAYRESLNAWLLAREMSAATGKTFSSGGDSMATPEMSEFWNDYYREKQSLDKWKNSAKRQYILDGLDSAKSLLDLGTGASSLMKGRGGAFKASKASKYAKKRKWRR